MESLPKDPRLPFLGKFALYAAHQEGRSTYYNNTQAIAAHPDGILYADSPEPMVVNVYGEILGMPDGVVSPRGRLRFATADGTPLIIRTQPGSSESSPAGLLALGEDYDDFWAEPLGHVEGDHPPYAVVKLYQSSQGPPPADRNLNLNMEFGGGAYRWAAGFPGDDYVGFAFDRAGGGFNLKQIEFSKSLLRTLGPLDLSHTYLGPVSLARLYLEKIDLSGSVLTGADLSGADLSGADLSGADLSGANLSGARLDGADLRNATLRGANLSGADLTKAHVKGLDLRSNEERTDLRSTKFCDLDFTGVEIDPSPLFARDSAIQPTSFRGSTMSYALIGTTDWSYLDMGDVVFADSPPNRSLNGLNATNVNLSNVSLSGLSLQQAVFNGARLEGTNLTSCNMMEASLKGANMTGGLNGGQAAALTGAFLVNVDMADAILSGADLSYTYFLGDQASVAGATLNQVNFSNACLLGLDFSAISDGQLQGATFSGACLANCNFRGANLGIFESRAASFSNANLLGADFSDATLFGADLSGAAVALQEGQLTVPINYFSNGYRISYPDTITYQATVLPVKATSAQTVCPNNQNGPCEPDTLSSGPIPTKWEMPTKAGSNQGLDPSQRANQGDGST